jgi:lipoxygenase
LQLLHAYPVDPLTESRPEKNNLDIYVPPDERFSPKKLSEFISKSIQASVHLLIPEAKSLLKQDSSSFHSFEETRSMFSSNKSRVEGWVEEELKKMVPDKLFKEVIQASKKNPLKFPLPQIIEGELHNCHNLYKPAQLMKHHFH